MSIKLRKKPAASVATPGAPYVQLFVDDDGLPKIKDSNGDVTQLSEAANSTLALNASYPIGNTVLENIPGMSWNLTQFNEKYCFEVHLAITQSSAPGVVGVSMARANVSQFIQNVTSIKANGSASGFSTNGSSTSQGVAIADAASRAIGGPFETIITGSFFVTGAGTLTLQAQRSAGVSTIEAGSWGRVWKASGV